MRRFQSIVLILVLFLVAHTAAQYMSGPRLSGVGLPFFRTAIFRSFNQDGSHRVVTIYIQMVNDDLTFMKYQDKFVAAIEYEIFLSDKNKKTIYNRTVSKKIETTNFNETNSRDIQNTFAAKIELDPGEYDAIINVKDKNTGKQINRKVHFRVEDFKQHHFLLSDIIAFHTFRRDSSGKIISFEPNLSNNFSHGEKYIYFYFTSIVQDTTDTLHIRYFIQDPAGNLSQFNQYQLIHQPRWNENFIRINRHQFDQNRYKLTVEGIYKGNIFKTHKMFSFYWTEVPESPRDLDLALRQMRYIMDADSIDWALKQPYKEKLAYFKRFWKRMDPNPDTKKNELMEEYFRRVNYANENFSTMSLEGWQTDRGRIFIKFGEPDDIERHPFEMGTLPYEVWRYYSLRKVFVFIDRTGFGDYYLHPNYLDEEFN